MIHSDRQSQAYLLGAGSGRDPIMGTALVTGASGFIGRVLCERLKAEGHQVHAVMRRPADGPWDAATLIDLGRGTLPLGLLSGVDTLFHLAGRAHALGDGPGSDEAYRLANLQSTLDLLAAARAEGVRAFVYFSSVKALGEAGDREVSECPETLPTSPYGRTKRLAELAVLEEHSVPHPVVLRPSLVYGPDPKGYLGQMIRATRSGWFPPLPELGNRRSMIHVEDVVEAALLCAVDPRARGRAYNLTDGSDYSTRQVYEYILEALGRPMPHWTLPTPLLRWAAYTGDTLGRIMRRRLPFDSDTLEKLLGSARYDGGSIRRELGFEPRHGLRESMGSLLATTGT